MMSAAAQKMCLIMEQMVLLGKASLSALRITRSLGPNLRS